VVHVLWLLVLVELVVPPVFEVRVLPARWSSDDVAPRARIEAAAVPDVSDLPEGRPAGTHRTASRDPRSAQRPVEPSPQAAAMATASAGVGWVSWGHLLAVVLVVGTGALSSVMLLRLLRFRRLLKHAVDAPMSLQGRAADVARRFGLTRPPRVRLVPGRMPPALWPDGTSGQILLPAALLSRLAPEEIDALLAHEVAHLRRRDHWLRPFELLVMALCWWHPVAWWARRQLRRAEEQACDAMVLQTFRSRPRVYAESLVKTVEFLALPGPAVPSLATGATGAAPLKERITMILKTKPPHALSPLLRLPLLALLSLAVLVSPSWVEKAASVGPADPARNSQLNLERQHQQELLEIQKQEVQLHREMQRLEQERTRVQRKIDEKLMQRQLEHMSQELQAFEQEGKQAEAQQLRRAMAEMRREAELQRQESELEQSMIDKRMQIEYELQDLAIEMQKVELAGELQKHEELLKRNLELEQSLRRLDLEALQNQLQLQRRRLESESKQLEDMQ
jgi:beta-lactamase regulating signal transducer with metallopeptidase domain